MYASYELSSGKAYKRRIKLKQEMVCLPSKNADVVIRIIQLHDTPKLERIK